MEKTVQCGVCSVGTLRFNALYYNHKLNVHLLFDGYTRFLIHDHGLVSCFKFICEWQQNIMSHNWKRLVENVMRKPTCTALNTLVWEFEPESMFSDAILCWPDFVRYSHISKQGWVSAKWSYGIHQNASLQEMTTKRKLWRRHLRHVCLGLWFQL